MILELLILTPFVSLLLSAVKPSINALMKFSLLNFGMLMGFLAHRVCLGPFDPGLLNQHLVPRILNKFKPLTPLLTFSNP